MIDTSLLGITLHTGYVHPLGLEFPRTSEMLTDMQKWFLERFGADFDIRSETHAGRMIEAATMLLSRVLGRNAYSYNQLNVEYATGQYLDTIASLLNITRESATYSRKKCYFYGTPDCEIGAGSTCFSKEGTKYAVESLVKLRGNTKMVGYVISLDEGDVEIGDVTVVGTRTDDTQDVGEWFAVESTGSTFYGTKTESDAALRKRILARMALVKPFLVRVKEELEAIPGVMSTFVYDNGRGVPVYVTEENDIMENFNDVAPYYCPEWDGAAASTYVANTAVTHGGLFYRCVLSGGATHPSSTWIDSEWRQVPRATPVMPHAIFVSIDEDLTQTTMTQDVLEQRIASVLYVCKSTGAGMTPSFLPSSETDSPYNIPIDLPGDVKYNACVRRVNYRPAGINCTYTMTFNLPELVRFYVEVTVKKNQYLGADLVADIKAAVLKWMQNKVPYVDGLTVGQSVYPFEIGNAISDVIPDIQIIDVTVGVKTEIGVTGKTTVVAQDHIPIAPTQKGYVLYTDGDTNDVIVNIVTA